MATQTGSIDLTASLEAHDDAAKTASKYITDVTNDGIMVHAEGAGPDDTQTPSGWHISDVLEYLRQGVSRFWIGLKNVTDTTPTVRIGKAYVEGATDNESHMELDYHSLQMVDKEGDTYFLANDLRDASGYITQTYTGDGSTTTYRLGFTSTDTEYSVFINNVEQPSTAFVSKYTTAFTFTSAPANNAVITARFLPAAPYHRQAKAYTFGKPLANQPVGEYSVREGYRTIASGGESHAEGYGARALGTASHAEGTQTQAVLDDSHAEGHESVAHGAYSHAQGYRTYAQKAAQFTCGTYNIKDTASGTTHPNGQSGYGTYAFILGNGTADNARSNGAVIDWLGNYIAQGWAGITQMFAGAVTQTVDSDGVATATGAPAGWLLCDGSAVSRTTYATLYAAIGDTWGAGDGSTTFNLPDLRGRAPIGAGTGSGLTARTLGGKVGAETHTLTAAQVPTHTHSLTNALGLSSGTWAGETYSGSLTGSGAKLAHTTGSGTVSTLTATGAKTGTNGQAHPIMQPSAVVNFIIHTGKTN